MDLSEFKQQLQRKKEVYLRLKVRPNAAMTALKDIMSDETVKIDIAAKPEQGKANAVLIKFLAKEFGIAKENIKMLSGVSERLKLIKIIK